MAARDKRFTIYDMMEAKGIFEANPANQSSPEYSKPIEYPKMMYHPTGQTRVTTPAEIIVTPLGPKAVGEQRELVSKIVSSETEEIDLLSQGWHLHPADSIAEGGGSAPAKSAEQRINETEASMRRMQAELEVLRAEKLAGLKPSGASV